MKVSFLSAYGVRRSEVSYAKENVLISDEINESVNAEIIQLVTQEKYDAILAIEKADKKCTDSVLV